MLTCRYAREDAFDHLEIVTSPIMRLANFFKGISFEFYLSHVLSMEIYLISILKKDIVRN